MGSSRFSAPDDKISPMSPKRSRWREEWAPLLAAKSFYTLPILFERGAYVIALELPPWAADLIEDSYVRNLWNNARGSSICSSNEQAETWRKTLRPQFTLELLKAVVPDAPVYDELQLADRGGRPRILDRIVEVWRNLDLGNSTLSWKERQRLVSEKLGESVSESSLRRADELARKPED